MARVKYDDAFKSSAVDLVLSKGYSIPKAAESLGLHSETLRYWVKTRRRDLGLSAGSEDAAAAGGVESLGQLRAQVAHLKRENARLLMEREILKKATAFFAKEGS